MILLNKKSLIEEALTVGAMAYVSKEYAFTNLVNAINAVMNGEIYLCQEVAKIAIESYVRNHLQTKEIRSRTLTKREREILKLLAKGKPSKEVALILGISVKTVDAYRLRIMKKLDVQSIAELVKYAIKEGLTSID